VAQDLEEPAGWRAMGVAAGAAEAPLRAKVGDTLIVEREGMFGAPRIGEIIAVIGPDGSPPYRVRWLAGEYESVVLPGPDARVEKRH
jgi:hypothetical protein